MKHTLWLLLISVLVTACSKSEGDNNNDDDPSLPVPVKKCHLTAAKNSNGVVISKLDYNRPENFDLLKQHTYSSSGAEQEYYKYYAKEVSGNKYIYTEHHVFDGANDYVNGYMRYAINKANNLFIDSSETFSCSGDQCSNTGNPDLDEYTKILSETYTYNTNYKLAKTQVYDIDHLPAGYKMYSYSATGLLTKEEIFGEDDVLSQSLQYTYSGANKDFAFKGEPNQVDKLFFGYARSIQENQLDAYLRSTGSYSIQWVLTRYDDASELKGYLKTIAMDINPTLTTTYLYELCE